MVAKKLAAELASHTHGRVPRELRRRQVLAEAHRLFAERGYAGASMDELARRVGVSKPVVYDLARSKEQLFRDVMAKVQEDLAMCVASAVAAETDPSKKLHTGVLAFLRFVHRNRKGWATLFSTEAGSASAEVATVRHGQVALVAALMAERAGAGGAAMDPRALEALAHGINGAVEAVALWWQAHPELSAEALAGLLASLLSPGLESMLEGRSGGW